MHCPVHRRRRHGWVTSFDYSILERKTRLKAPTDNRYGDINRHTNFRSILDSVQHYCYQIGAYEEYRGAVPLFQKQGLGTTSILNLSASSQDQIRPCTVQICNTT
jgi:hypothetical protein